MKYSEFDDYVDKESGVLKNKLGLTTQKSLDEAESSGAFMRALELAEKPIHGNFDLAHLKKIHQKLFGDIYEWAGEIRTIDISKGNTRFASNNYIESEARKLTSKLEQEQYLQGLDSDQFSERAAHYLGELNVLHPFREGNGRSLRVFMTQLAQEAGYHIQWRNIEPEDMIRASIEAYESSATLMKKLIKDNLVDLYREHVIEQATAATGKEIPMLFPETGERYHGSIVALNVRYVAQEIGELSALVLHERKFLSGLDSVHDNMKVEVSYPCGRAGVIHPLDQVRDNSRE